MIKLLLKFFFYFIKILKRILFLYLIVLLLFFLLKYLRWFIRKNIKVGKIEKTFNLEVKDKYRCV